MKNIIHSSKALIKREFCAYFHNPLALVFLVAFLFLNAFLTFRFGSWFELGKADLLPFFTFQPWLYLFFIPALAMRTWAEEEHQGTVELLLTMPVTVGQVVFCKFLASWAFLALTLFLTLPMALTAEYLGDPDWGRIIAGYTASFLLGGTFLAIASVPSALSRNQVISYIISFLVLLLLSGLALQQVNDLIPDALSTDVQETLSLFSVEPHFEAFHRGVMDARDLFYNLSVIAYALLATAIILRYRKAAHKHNRFFSFCGSLILLFILVFANVFAKKVTWRIDLTQDGLYSLSKDTQDLISDIQQPLHLRFYFSRSSKESSPSQKAHALRVSDLLKEFSFSSNGLLTYEILDPAADKQTEKFARLNGMSAINFDAKNPVYCGLAFQYLGKNLQIGDVASVPEEELEYHICRKIRQLVSKKKPLIATLTQSPIYFLKADPLKGRVQDQHEWKIISELVDEYGLEMNKDLVNLPPSIPNLSSKVDLLILIHPPRLDEQTLYALDQYMVNGGKILCFLDSFAALNVKQTSQGEMLVPPSSNLQGLAGNWGVRFLDKKIVVDKKNARVVSNYKVPTFLEISDGALSVTEPSTKALKKLLFPYAGAFDYRETKGLKKEILIESSSESQLIDCDLAMQNDKINQDFIPSGKHYSLAMKISGNFTSAFSLEDIPKSSRIPHKDNSEAEGRVILVGDADLLSDDFTYQKKSEGAKSEKISSNTEFFLNLVDELLNKKTLINLRSRLPQPRLLDELEDFKFKNASLNMAEKKGYYDDFQKSATIEKEILKKRHDQVPLTIGDEENLANALLKKQRAEDQLRSLQVDEEKQVKVYQQKFFLTNLLAVPILLILISFFAAVFRYKKMKKS